VSIVDAVTARALQYGLRPAVPATAPADLAELAHHERVVLLHALRRVDRALLERPSAVAEHARAALERALSLCAVRPTVDARASGSASA
jgi:hypothetical protein